MEKIELKTPLREEDVCRLRVGQVVYVTGTIVTARDAAHKRVLEYLRGGKKLSFTFYGLPLFHCGPLVKKADNRYFVLSAGPTTSMRLEPFEDEIIKNLGVRLIIGKGGMGEKTRRAMREFGGTYAVFTGGAGVLAAEKIKKVAHVEWLDLGISEAMWFLKVKGFGPLIIAMDSQGNSLFEKVQAEAEKNKAEIIRRFETQKFEKTPFL